MAEVSIKVTVDENDAVRGLEAVAREGEDFDRALNGTFDSVARGAKERLGAMSVDALVPMVMDFANVGNAARDMQIQSAIAFGDQLADVEAWADEVKGMFGETDTVMENYAARAHTALTNAGVSQSTAAEMAMELVEAAGKLALVSPEVETTAEAFEALFMAVTTGEMGVLEELGVFIDEDKLGELKQQLMDSGIPETAAEAQALSDIILSQLEPRFRDLESGAYDGAIALNETRSKGAEAREELGLLAAQAVDLVAIFSVDYALPFFDSLIEKTRTANSFISNMAHSIPGLAGAAGLFGYQMPAVPGPGAAEFPVSGGTPSIPTLEPSSGGFPGPYAPGYTPAERPLIVNNINAGAIAYDPAELGRVIADATDAYNRQN